MSFLWGHWYPCFRLLVMSALGFKARVDIACMLSCLHATPQIHPLWDTFWPLDGHHGGLSQSLHASFSRGRMPGFERVISRSKHRCSTHSATAPGFWIQLCSSLVFFLKIKWDKLLKIYIFRDFRRWRIYNSTRCCFSVVQLGDTMLWKKIATQIWKYLCSCARQSGM